MNKNLDNYIRERMAERPSVSGYTQQYGRKGSSGAWFNRTAQKKKLVFIGAGIVVVIILIVLFSGDGDEQSSGELASIKARVTQLEQRLMHVEKIANKIAMLEKQQAALQRLTEEKLVQLAQTGRGSQREPGHLLKRRYHEVQPGDNLSRIAEDYGISMDQLCRLNKMTPEEIIHPGQKLLVVPSHR